MKEQLRVSSWPVLVDTDLKIKTGGVPIDLPEGARTLTPWQFKQLVVKEMGAKPFWREYHDKEPRVDPSYPPIIGVYKIFAIMRRFAPRTEAELSSSPTAIILPLEEPKRGFYKRKPSAFERRLMRRFRRAQRQKTNDS